VGRSVAISVTVWLGLTVLGHSKYRVKSRPNGKVIVRPGKSASARPPWFCVFD
jgi:hypothetical protein